ncbi:MAG TPA: hypothetical protein VMK16_05810 [Acidimicrobiales bacterium]|nr:hypothetical protein [Acidimicrobiales bacterium]
MSSEHSEYAPFLEKGEEVVFVVRALSGINRWVGLGFATIIGIGVSLLIGSVLLGLLALFVVFSRLYARRLIVGTDRAVVLMSGRRFTFKPTSVIERFPKDTRLTPLKGIWLELTLGEHRLYVTARSLKVLRAR